MSNTIRLVTSQAAPAKRACATCRHLRRKGQWCGAVGDHIHSARMFESFACGTSGKLWEKKPDPEPWPGLFPLIWRFFFGSKTT